MTYVHQPFPAWYWKDGEGRIFATQADVPPGWLPPAEYHASRQKNGAVPSVSVPVPAPDEGGAPVGPVAASPRRRGRPLKVRP